MRFQIHCRNPKTGQSHEFQLDAHDRREAKQQVVDAGLVVGLIEIATEKAGGDTPPPFRPPGEAAEREIRRARRRVGIAGRIIGVGGIVAIVLAVLGTILSGGREAFRFHEIKVSVRFDGEQFTIVNRDDFSWHDIRIDVNGGLANRGYAVRWDVLVSQQMIVAKVTDFIDEKGNPYDPVNEPLRQLRIICDVGDGNKALHTRRWQP